MTESAATVALENVTVTYGKNTALRDVTASFPAGAVGLLGPNGAGKSTMIKSLLGFLVPTRGRLRVLGLDVADVPLEIRARVGYMPESDGHIPGMNAVSFVAYCGQLAGLPPVDAMQRAHEVLYYVGLGEARYRNVETYSYTTRSERQCTAAPGPRRRRSGSASSSRRTSPMLPAAPWRTLTRKRSPMNIITSPMATTSS